MPDLMFYGMVLVGGPPEQVNAYRAELQGLHSLLAVIEIFCLHHQIQSGGITIGCDNKGAISQAQCFNKYVPCSNPIWTFLEPSISSTFVHQSIWSFNTSQATRIFSYDRRTLPHLPASTFRPTAWQNKNSIEWQAYLSQPLPLTP